MKKREGRLRKENNAERMSKAQGGPKGQLGFGVVGSVIRLAARLNLNVTMRSVSAGAPAK